MVLFLEKREREKNKHRKVFWVKNRRRVRTVSEIRDRIWHLGAVASTSIKGLFFVLAKMIALQCNLIIPFTPK